MKKNKIKVLFLCTGNICRSPLGEGIFKHVVKEAGLVEDFHITSAGTGSWHEGEQAHKLSRAIAKQRGISIEDHRASVFDVQKFDSYDLILAMDNSHIDYLEAVRKNSGTTVKLLREYDPEIEDDLEVPDPYYGTMPDYENVYDMTYRACVGLLEALKKEKL